MWAALKGLPPRLTPPAAHKTHAGNLNKSLNSYIDILGVNYNSVESVRCNQYCVQLGYGSSIDIRQCGHGASNMNNILVLISYPGPPSQIKPWSYTAVWCSYITAVW